MSDVTQQITEYCLKILLNQIGRTLDAAPDYLTLLADQTNFDNERSMYLDAMHELRFTRKKVFDTISKEIEKPFELLLRGTVPQEFQRQGGLIRNVTGATELEEKLALETMLNKAQAKSEIPLHNISRSLDAMMGNDWVKKHYNPLDPEFIIRAWVAGTHQMQLHPKGFLGLYALLDSELLSKLNRIYEKISQQIESLSNQPGARRAAPQEKPSADNSDMDDFEAMFGDIDNISPESSGSYSTADTDSAESYDAPLVTTDQITRKLTELQSNRALDDSNYYSSNYLLDLRDLLQGEGLLSEGDVSAQTIGEVNNDILDMTKLMFGFIMDDYNIPDDIRYYISRLQIPYLKLGLLDRTLFQDKEHPGRQLLMELSQSINNWDPIHTSGIDQLLTEIMRVVDELLQSFDINTELFEIKLQEFKAFLEGDSHIDDSMRERQKSRETHAHKADNAKLIIEGSLADLCAGKRIPPIVERILTEYWSKVLFIEFLKEGEESDSYQALLETADILVGSVQAKSSEAERKAMAKILPQIVKRLKEGLNLISIASFESVDLFRELQQCHMEVLKERPEESDALEFEVSDEAYDSFQAETKKNEIPWDRSAIEASMLEENIERSIAMSSSEPMFEDDNPNVIRQSKSSPVGESTISRADREREIIDNELKEARDAYERALQEHKQKKSSEAEQVEESGEDDFMSMFFQDPNFVENQTEALHKRSETQSETDSTSSLEDMDQFSNDVDLDDLQAQTHSSSAELSQSESDFLSQELSRTSQKSEVSDTKDTNYRENADTSEEIKEELADNNVTLTKESQEDLTTQPEEPNEVEPALKANNPAQGRARGAEIIGKPNLLHDDVNELIERLKVGLWVDLYHADGQKVRAKIMAIVPTVGKYIFGDRAGKKLADYNRQSLYDAIKEGRIQLSDVDTAYDKTLESVISNLRVMKKAEDE